MIHPIGRRAVLGGLLGAPLVAIGAMAGCERVAPRGSDRAARRRRAHIEGAIRGPSIASGHALRDGTLRQDGVETTHRARVVIVGAGIAGLSAAWRLRHGGVEDLVLLELEPMPGGTACAGYDGIVPYPWGAHYVPAPSRHDAELTELFSEMGAIEGRDDEGRARVAEHVCVREPAERVFWNGFWHEGLVPEAALDARDREEMKRWRAHVDALVARRDGCGRRAFTLPIARCASEPELLAWDAMRADRWLEAHGYRSRWLRWLLDYATRDDYGLRLSQTSAWAMLLYEAARIDAPGQPAPPYMTWPQGNGAIVEHLAAPWGERLRTGRLVQQVQPRPQGGVSVRAVHVASGQRERWDAEHAVVCVPRFVARRIVVPLRDGPDDAPPYGAWVVANLHLRDRPRGRGFPAAWDNVLVDADGLGYVCATHQRGRDHGPTVLTYYRPLLDDDPRAARRWLERQSWSALRDLVLDELGVAHPDLDDLVERLDVWRWGHAMPQPRPGVVWNAARRAAARPLGAIHFAHTDLSGLALFEEAFHHGLRAADEVLDALRGRSVAS
ncbi:MAG: FAD-dependent oxidoreductase [Myxococcota bacterium]|nr:FAD-dependent oxidoreductase [Myxococcota bacterium]MDW8363882.1 FAD-dependent oxidoreductase [Myxococcales bacterium]